MKKTSVLLSMIILLFVITACGLIVETRTFNLSKNGVSVDVEYKAQGKNITEFSGKTSMSYEFMGVNSEEEARRFFQPISEDATSGEGWTQEIEYTDTDVYHNVFVDFKVVDFDEIELLPGVILNKRDKKGDEIQEAIDRLNENGFEGIN